MSEIGKRLDAAAARLAARVIAAGLEQALTDIAAFTGEVHARVQRGAKRAGKVARGDMPPRERP